MDTQARVFVGLVTMTLLSACGSGGAPPLPDPPDSPEVSVRRIEDLMECVGEAAIYQNWHMLASLHGTESTQSPESLAAQFGDALSKAGDLSHVAKVKALDGGAYAVTVGNGPDPNAANFQGITFTAVPEEVSGHYVVSELAAGA